MSALLQMTVYPAMHESSEKQTRFLSSFLSAVSIPHPFLCHAGVLDSDEVQATAVWNANPSHFWIKLTAEAPFYFIQKLETPAWTRSHRKCSKKYPNCFFVSLSISECTHWRGKSQVQIFYFYFACLNCSGCPCDLCQSMTATIWHCSTSTSLSLRLRPLPSWRCIRNTS